MEKPPVKPTPVADGKLTVVGAEEFVMSISLLASPATSVYVLPDWEFIVKIAWAGEPGPQEIETPSHLTTPYCELDADGDL
jgi:hypothetical protein